VHPEGRPISRILNKQSGLVLGWLYLWNDETLGVLWLTEVRENLYLENTALMENSDVLEFLSNL
jgi:hypothetical protein